MRLRPAARISVFGLLLTAMFSLGQAAPASSPASAPNDPDFPQQWALHNDGTQSIPIDADPLHTLMQKGIPGVDIGWLDARAEMSKLNPAPVTVAVIDTGIDTTHPDLAGRIAPQGFDFINAAKDAANHIANNTSTMSDEPDVPPGQDPSTSDAGHGTHVSGVIIANSDNGIGIAGIAPPSVQVLPLRVLSDQYKNFAYNGRLISDYVADAVNYVVKNHAASIINLSLGWPKIVDTQNARNAIQSAINQGILVVAAAGNDRKELPTYPCAYPGVLCVGAVTNTGAMALYSNLGGMVDILAPGDSIVSTYPMDVESKIMRVQGYEIMSGTSMASPQVAGVAAALKAVIPNLSLEELKARLLISAAQPPTNGALYGVVNLERALDAKPQPVFLPDFKSIDSVTVDEASLQVQGQISVENLWAEATGVEAEIAVNGVSAGTAQAASLAQGGKLAIPWKYAFRSLDDSSNLHLSLVISDSAGDSKTFSVDIPAARAMEKIAGSKTTSFPAIAPGGPIIVTSGVTGESFTNLELVSSYPSRAGAPQYFMQHRKAQGGYDYGAAGCLVDILNASAASAAAASATTPIQTVQVPGIQRVVQVLRLSAPPSSGGAASSGDPDWVIIGLGGIDSPNPDYEFYFLDPGFHPLWGANGGSQWVIGLSSGLGEEVIRDYSAPGSWVLSGGKLIPSFLAQTTLPDPDNFSGFEYLHYQPDQHLIYLLPQAQSGNNPIQLQARALDNAAFRGKFASNPHLMALIPPDPADARAGHLRALLTVGDDLTAQTLLWDIPSVTSSSTAPAPGWNQLSSSGAPMQALSLQSPAASSGSAGSASQSAFLNFFDQARGSLAWATSQGQFLDLTEFAYSRVANPFAGLIGAFDLPSLGRFWFAQTQFDLVGYRQASATGDAGITMQTLPIDRDSTFQDEDFSRMFMPVLVGTSANPLPGVYIDSTVVRGNMVSVAVWNPRDNALEKPLRYSLQVPGSCLQMNPIHLNAAPESFALPIFCLQPGASQAQLTLVFPQPGSP